MSTCHILMFLCMMWFCRSLSLTSIQGHGHDQSKTSTSLCNPEDGKVTLERLRPWRIGYLFNRHHHTKIAHGVVNIIGWGILLPIGVMIARYWREVQENWYWLHIACQIAGFILGTIGWGLGMALRNAAERHNSLTTHGVLGTIILTFTSLQVLAICVQPKRENGWRKCWVIYHHLLGYALIALIIANIFEGAANQNSANKWRWFYIAILGVLVSIVLSLEFLRCFKFFKQMNKGVK